MKIKNFMIWHSHRRSKGKIASKLAPKLWLRRAVYQLVRLYDKLIREKDSLPLYHENHLRKMPERNVKVNPLSDKAGRPSVLGRGAFACVRQGRDGNELVAVKMPNQTIEEVRREEFEEIERGLKKIRTKGRITEEEYQSALLKAEQLVEGYNSPEVECRLAQECACEFVAIPEMVDGQQVMPLHGRSLRSLFSVKAPNPGDPPELKPLPEEWVKKLFKQALTAVHVVHGCGIAHRDIKPDNFLVNSVGELKLTDFGLACRASDDAPVVRSDEATEADLLLLQSSSTPVYAPPDKLIFSGGDERAGDAWALGVTLVEMLTAENFFYDKERAGMMPAATVQKAKDEKMDGRRRALARLEEMKVDPEAISLVRGLLETDPMKRMTVDKALESDYLKDVDLRH